MRFFASFSMKRGQSQNVGLTSQKYSIIEKIWYLPGISLSEFSLTTAMQLLWFDINRKKSIHTIYNTRKDYRTVAIGNDKAEGSVNDIVVIYLLVALKRTCRACHRHNGYCRTLDAFIVYVDAALMDNAVASKLLIGYV